MKVLMSGGHGFVGKALAGILRSRGHSVSHLVRPGSPTAPGDVRWDPHSASIDMAAMEGAEAVIHLSGAGIADGRWTPERKELLRSSRVDSTRVLVDALRHLREKPRAFVCASAIGYYGDRGEEILTESSMGGVDFLALLTRDWEAEADRAAHAGIRTVMLRFGVIFAADGGALPKMLAPFRWSVGGRLGNGKQWLSWVTREDAVETAYTAVVDDRFSGPVNVVAPNPLRNEDFTRIAAAALHRRAFFPAPAFALRMALGEMAQPLLLASERVIPKRLQEFGYNFRDEHLEQALPRLLGNE